MRLVGTERVRGGTFCIWGSWGISVEGLQDVSPGTWSHLLGPDTVFPCAVLRQKVTSQLGPQGSSLGSDILSLVLLLGSTPHPPLSMAQ